MSEYVVDPDLERELVALAAKYGWRNIERMLYQDPVYDKNLQINDEYDRADIGLDGA